MYSIDIAATAPQEVTVAKTADTAAIDPHTRDEIISMNIKFYDFKTGKEVIDDVNEKRVKLFVSRVLHQVENKDVMINSKEDADKLQKQLESEQSSGYYNDALSWFHNLNSFEFFCLFNNLKGSITLEKSIGGIKQIIIESRWDFIVVTENCYSHLDDNTNLLTDVRVYNGPDDNLIKAGNKLLSSKKIIKETSILYDAIDINREANRLIEWFKKL